MLSKRIICWTVLMFLNKANGANDFFIARKLDSFYCVTNTTFALSWIDDFMEGFQEESQFTLSHHDNYIDNFYDIERYFIGANWKFVHSLEIKSPINQPIFDRRWEGFNAFKTVNINKNTRTLEYVKVLDNLRNDFEIPVSIRATNEAHIFLCNGSYPTYSNCYWILLEAFRGNRSAIRKCGKPDFVPETNTVYAQNECKIERDSVEHPKFPSFLSPTKWSHLKLSKKVNVLSVSLLTYDGDKKFLEFSDLEESINVTHMFVHCKNASALWKIHNAEFMYTNNELNTEIPLITRRQVFPTMHEVCIAMFLSMCDSCKLKLSLTNEGGIIDEKTFHSGHSKWTEIKFLAIGNWYYVSNLLISTIGQSPERFWGIDKIRSCGQKEYRMIYSRKNVSCQLLSGEDDVISIRNSEPLLETTCPENTIGDFCVPCDSMTYGNCKQVTICTKQKCVCAADYQGNNCSEECSRNKYGHGCQQTCGKCYKSPWSLSICNNVNGTCTRGCINRYSGPKCDIPPSVIFKNPPQVTEVSVTAARILVNDFSVTNSADLSLRPVSYTIQYKKEEDLNKTMWESHNSNDKFNKPNVVLIENLEADTNYVVRAVITTLDGRLNNGSNLKFTKFTTKCEDVSIEDTTVTCTNTSVELFVNKKIHSCQLNRYRIILKEDNSTSSQNGNSFYFENLKPFTKYTISFQNSDGTMQEKKIQTKEGVPEPVRSLRIMSTSSTTIDFKWDEPTAINGDFLYYIVEYQLISRIACKHRESTPSSKIRQHVTDTSITINNLIPYSDYTFSVFVSNSLFQGPAQEVHAKTLSLDTLESDEIPKINIFPDVRNANIELIFRCTNVLGPISVETTLTCTNEWCNNRSTKFEMSNTQFYTNFVVDNLNPFSDYVLAAKYCRSESNCRPESENITFKTKPAVPYLVTELSVYNKNEGSISLRWKPPYPPTGVLHDYKIVYYYKVNRATHSTDQFVNIASCRIWQDFHCTTLYDLKPNKRYNIEISSRNINPSNFSLPSSIVRGDTKIDKSDPPYNVSVFWTDLNDLELRWNHPNRTNGDVQYFGINVNSRSESVHRKLFVNDFNVTLNYNYTIDAEELTPTTNYNIKIWAYNTYFGDEAEITAISPPDIPKLNFDPQIISSSDDTVTLKLSVKEPLGQSDSFHLFVLTSTNLESNLSKTELQEFKTVLDCTIKHFEANISITVSSNTLSENCVTTANSLDIATIHLITFKLANTFLNQTKYNLYSLTLEKHSNLGFLGFLALLLLVPCIIFFVRKLKKKRTRESVATSANVPRREPSYMEVLDFPPCDIPMSIQAQRNPAVFNFPTNLRDVASNCILISEFKDYVKQSFRDEQFQLQYELLPLGQTKPWTRGSLQENTFKNRYNNIIAYDDSRVHLQKINRDPFSDYINANYVHGYDVPRAYIATQTPNFSTANDFWRMIWQENVKCIVNLSNLSEYTQNVVKKYWPDMNETGRYGDITVKFVSRKTYCDFEHRCFIVTHVEDARKVDELHFISWPDQGVPNYSQILVPFIQKMLEFRLSLTSPLVVHCKTGVDRTGTVLLCDMSVRCASVHGKVNVFANLQILREHRVNMVDSVDQYKLAHLVILECMSGIRTSIQCSEIKQSLQKILTHGELSLQMEYLERTQWQDEVMRSRSDNAQDVQVPSCSSRYLKICAVRVDGFQGPDRFLVTQQPSSTTLADFWRLADENGASVIISLNEIDKRKNVFWPTEATPMLQLADDFILNHVSTISSDCYDIITVNVASDAGQNSKSTTIISMKGWLPKENVPRHVTQFVAFWEKSYAMFKQSNRIIVTCFDGVFASGLYVAMTFVIEKMKLEQVCDVCQAVRSVRRNCNQFVRNEEQFAFLYKAAEVYINQFILYANFN